MGTNEEFQAPSSVRGVRALDGGLEDTRTLPRVAANAPLARQPAAVPAGLAGMLLPTEHVTFAGRPHRIVFLSPAIAIVAVTIALTLALTILVHPIVRGHHVDVPWLDR